MSIAYLIKYDSSMHSPDVQHDIWDLTSHSLAIISAIGCRFGVRFGRLEIVDMIFGMPKDVAINKAIWTMIC